MLTISIISLSFLWIGQNRIIGETRQRNVQLASIISRDVNARISSIYSDARIFSRHLESLSPLLYNQTAAMLSLRLSAPQRYRAVYYFDGGGNLLLYLTDTLENLLEIEPVEIATRPPIPVDEEITSAYRAIGTASTSISEVRFTGIDRTPVLYVGFPLNFADGVTRALVLELDLRDIWQRINLSTIGQTGFAYAVSRDGTIIAHPEASYLGNTIPSVLNPLLAGYEGFTGYTEPIKQTAVLTTFNPVGGPTGWGIVVQQDESEVLASMLRSGALIVGVWIALALFGTFGIRIMMRNFTAPIVELTRTTQNIANTGFLAKTGMIQSPDEVGQLSHAFDGMIDRLQTAEGELRQSHEELESRVASRTAELSGANARLQQEIAQRAQAQEALRRSETKYRHLVESANTIIIEMDTSGKITFFNKFAQDFFGYNESEILGKSVIGTIVPPKDTSGKDLEAMIEDIGKHPERYLHNENENMRRNGERVWIVWTNQPLYNEEGNFNEIMCIGINRTEQKKAEELLARETKEKATAEERNRLARDLHDAVSQTLFSASLIAEVLPRIWERHPDEGRKRLEEVRQLTRGALAEMRTLLLELRPAALVEAELGDLLHQLGESITGRSRVPVAVTVEGKCALPAEAKIALYRIAQEALNNVAKHAGASQAKVNLQCQPGSIVLRISDNGKGFDMKTRSPDSFGLGIIQERAGEISASLAIESSIGHGTEVMVTYKDISGGIKQ
ncbi:MAG: PAS domain S-box protein [Dehalococcoidales bacterium]|nr:PAS domain S-box protein [Dehalococcoidales bacterium]